MFSVNPSDLECIVSLIHWVHYLHLYKVLGGGGVGGGSHKF